MHPFLEKAKTTLGTGWQTKLARLLNTNPRTVRRWVAGDVPVPEWANTYNLEAAIASAPLTIQRNLDTEDESFTVSFFWGGKPLWSVAYDIGGIDEYELSYTLKAMEKEATDKIHALQALGADFNKLMATGEPDYIIGSFLELCTQFWGG